jgi:hypothetical protein
MDTSSLSLDHRSPSGVTDGDVEINISPQYTQSTAEQWRATLARIVPAVVVLKVVRTPYFIAHHTAPFPSTPLPLAPLRRLHLAATSALGTFQAIRVILPFSAIFFPRAFYHGVFQHTPFRVACSSPNALKCQSIQ